VVVGIIRGAVVTGTDNCAIANGCGSNLEDGGLACAAGVKFSEIAMVAIKAAAAEGFFNRFFVMFKSAWTFVVTN
jgi:hypothetical protein